MIEPGKRVSTLQYRGGKRRPERVYGIYVGKDRRDLAVVEFDNGLIESIEIEFLDLEDDVPETVQFTYSVSDDYTQSEFIEWLAGTIGYPISDELAEKIGQPFEEVRVRCEMNMKTGKVTVITASL